MTGAAAENPRHRSALDKVDNGGSASTSEGGVSPLGVAAVITLLVFSAYPLAGLFGGSLLAGLVAAVIISAALAALATGFAVLVSTRDERVSVQPPFVRKHRRWTFKDLSEAISDIPFELFAAALLLVAAGSLIAGGDDQIAAGVALVVVVLAAALVRLLGRR